MKILVACEESQRVANVFRSLGHEAYSADLVPCSGGHPEYHIKGDVLPLINGRCTFSTMDGEQHTIPTRWDMIIAFPPCTYLSNVGNRWFDVSRYGEKAVKRWADRRKGAESFLQIAYADCDRIAIENPVGWMNNWRKPSQVVSPWMFATDASEYVTKRTCLWLKGLKPLKQVRFDRPNNAEIFGRMNNGKVKCWCDSAVRSATDRSRTFNGVARAMAEAWG